jgi:hypothetical protein
MANFRGIFRKYLAKFGAPIDMRAAISRLAATWGLQRRGAGCGRVAASLQAELTGR